MRSFAVLSFIATLAFSAFAGAAGTPSAAVPDASLPQSHGLATRACASCPPPPTCNNCDSGVVGGNVKSAVSILTDLQVTIQPHISALVNINADIANEDHISPHLKEICAALDVAVQLCTSLVGKTSAQILASVDASVIVTVSMFAQLLAGIIIAIVTVCAKLVIVVHGNVSICGPFFVSIGAHLAALVKICIQLVPGCLSILVSLLVSIVASIKVCAFVDLLAVLGISL